MTSMSLVPNGTLMSDDQSYLIDSQIVIWSAKDPSRIAPRHRAILNIRRRLWVSVASIWELEMKRATKKADFPDDLLSELRLSDINILRISADHAVEAAHLPFHHRDPFDRMLIAQARIEGLTILTADRHFARYDVALA